MTSSGQHDRFVDLAPTVPPVTSPEQCVAMWFDLVDATDEILLANLRNRGLSPAEVEAAYRECYARWVEEHDRKNLHLLKEFARRETKHGGRVAPLGALACLGDMCNFDRSGACCINRNCR